MMSARGADLLSPPPDGAGVRYAAPPNSGSGATACDRR